MSYVVLARKLRPSKFDDLVGQETISQTLKNAILSNRVAHAFLFTGSRGVGKTSAARILTKALNCLNRQGADPCNQCERCVSITQNASPDVFEIDAASNRGIENIRELRDNVKYAPAECTYKVYIIDEAHMLTLESFNALLKTLEEPPNHVKFILATTDPHKIPQTIISRCQRYDYVRIPLQAMANYLEAVTQNEQVPLARPILEMVARQAKGGMRDALTAIDQILSSYPGGQPSVEEAAQTLGMMESQTRFNLLDAILAKDSQRVMEVFSNSYQHGQDLPTLLAELLQSVKTLSLIQSVGSKVPTLFQDLSTDELERYTQMASRVSMDELQQMFHLLLQLEENLRQSSHAQICFEMALIQLSSVQSLIGIPELLAQLSGVEGKLPKLPTTAQQAIQTPSQPAPQAAPEQTTQVPPQETPQVAPQSIPQTPPPPQMAMGPQVPASPEPQPVTPPPPVQAQPIPPEPQPMVPKPQPIAPPVMPEPPPVASTPVQAQPMAPPEPQPMAPPVMPEPPVQAQPMAPEPQPIVPPAMPEPPVQAQPMAPTPPPTAAPSALQVNSLQEEWVALVAHIQSTSRRVGSILKNALLRERTETELQIVFKQSHVRDMISDQDLKQLHELVASFYNRSLKVFLTESTEDVAEMTISEAREYNQDQAYQQKHQAAENNETVQTILETFPESKVTRIDVDE